MSFKFPTYLILLTAYCVCLPVLYPALLSDHLTARGLSFRSRSAPAAACLGGQSPSNELGRRAAPAAADSWLIPLPAPPLRRLHNTAAGYSGPCHETARRVVVPTVEQPNSGPDFASGSR